MSMQHCLPDQAVRADPWTLLCAQCSRKMRIMVATPAQEGTETRTCACACGHSERINVAFIDGEPPPRRLRKFPRVTKDRP
jgi:prepilin-type processing-associated H-X9-DG protein